MDQNYISEEDYEDALGDDVYTRVQTTNQKKSNDSESGNSYYVDAVIDNVFEDLKEKLDIRKRRHTMRYIAMVCVYILARKKSCSQSVIK